MTEMAKKVMKNLKEEVQKKKVSNCRSLKKGKEGKSQMIASCRLLRRTSHVNAARKKE